MSIYYIVTKDNNIYELDATSNLVINESGTLSEFPLENGTTVADHYVNNNTTISMSGSISDIKSTQADNPDRAKSTQEFINGLRGIKQRKETFNLVWRAGNEEVLTQCMFENIQFGQDITRGYANGVYSYRVSLEIKQVRYAQQARITVGRAPELEDTTSEQQNGSGSTQDLTDSTTGEPLSASDLFEVGVVLSNPVPNLGPYLLRSN